MYELIIIGAGPAGISMATEAIKRGIPKSKILIIEKNELHSYSIRKFYPEKKLVMANYKGIDAACEGELCLVDMSKSDALSFFDGQISSNDIQINYSESVYKIEKEDSFTIFTDKNTYTSKTCIIAIGIMGRPNKPSYPIPQEIKEQVHYDITTKSIVNSNCLVVGGGDSASEYAQYLLQGNNKVSLSYRRDSFTRMNDINKNILYSLEEKNKIQILLNTDIESLSQSNNEVAVTFKDGQVLNYDNIILALGGSTPNNFLKQIGIEFEGNNPILKEGFETSIPGLFLIGDLSSGKKGGSIISAFNSSFHAMEKICESHLNCQI